MFNYLYPIWVRKCLKHFINFIITEKSITTKYDINKFYKSRLSIETLSLDIKFLKACKKLELVPVCCNPKLHDNFLEFQGDIGKMLIDKRLNNLIKKREEITLFCYDLNLKFLKYNDNLKIDELLDKLNNFLNFNIKQKTLKLNKKLRNLGPKNLIAYKN
jgi:hypothetical protein